MNIIEYAKRELDLVGMPEDSQDPLNLAMRNYILKAVEDFSNQNFSGISAANAVTILSRILQVQPLVHLTGEDWEWVEVEQNLYQNIRCGSVFKNSASAWDINGKIFIDKDGGAFTSSESRVYISFPYMPNKEYVNIDYSLSGISFFVSADGKECGSCKSAALVPFSGEAFEVELEDQKASISDLSGWRCSDCGQASFDLESAEKYGMYVREFAVHLSKLKQEAEPKGE
jgi:hypothetical protein